MAHPLINRTFYEAILQFEESDAAQEKYYTVMDTPVKYGGKPSTVRDQILRCYAMLFCEDIGAVPGRAATAEDVEATADRLYVGEPKFDRHHWYRMQHHFPVIDEDNFDRFAALVIADLAAGPLHAAAADGNEMLLVGDRDPLIMSPEERHHQTVRVISGEDLSLGGAQ